VSSTPGPSEGEPAEGRPEELGRRGADPGGEVSFVMSYVPESVLDVGCGTGRVAVELARRGVYVVGVERDASIDAAARLAEELREELPGARLEFVRSDIAQLEAGTFDVVLMAGNVPLPTPKGGAAALVAGAARHVRRGGLLIAGLQLDGPASLASHDRQCAAAGLEPTERWAGWDREPFAGGPFAVSVHRRP